MEFMDLPSRESHLQLSAQQLTTGTASAAESFSQGMLLPGCPDQLTNSEGCIKVQTCESHPLSQVIFFTSIKESAAGLLLLGSR